MSHARARPQQSDTNQSSSDRKPSQTRPPSGHEKEKRRQRQRRCKNVSRPCDPSIRPTHQTCSKAAPTNNERSKQGGALV